MLGRNLYLQEQRAATGEGSIEDLMTNGAVVGWVILPWLGCSLWLSYWVEMHEVKQSLAYWGPIAFFCLLILTMVELIIFAGGAPRAYRGLNPGAGWWRTKAAWAGFALGGVVATAAAVALGWAGMEATELGSVALGKWVHATLGAKDAINQSLSFSMSQVTGGVTSNVARSGRLVKDGVAGMVIDAWRIRLAMLPALLLSVPYVASELTLGFLGRDYWNMRREWLARLRAWSMLYALLWCGVVSVVFLGPYAGYYIEGKGAAWIWSSLIAFVAAHGTTIFAGWSGKGDGFAGARGGASGDCKLATPAVVYGFACSRQDCAPGSSGCVCRSACVERSMQIGASGVQHPRAYGIHVRRWRVFLGCHGCGMGAGLASGHQ